MRLSVFVAGATLALIASSANASLIVSGDSNIFGNTLSASEFAPNRRFLSNIAGAAGIVVQDSGRQFLTTQGDDVVAYYNANGFSATLLGSGAAVTSAALAGASLFIGFAPDDAYAAGELAALTGLIRRGGTVVLTGENQNFFADLNGILNAALPTLGSSMRIVGDNIDGGAFFAANILTANALTAGTERLQYAFTSRVSGGTGLYGTLSGNQTFVAFENVPVPEPASWALMIAGFGLAGAALRRRSATVRFA